jgi:CRISPR-associated protein Cmr2
MNEYRDPITGDPMNQQANQERWQQAVDKLIDRLPKEDLSQLCKALYTFLDQESRGKGGCAPQVPLCKHALDSYVTDHALLTSAIAYCLGYEKGLRGDKLNLLRLAAMAHDFPDDARQRLITGLSIADQEALKSAWMALDDQRGWLERIAKEGGFPKPNEANPPGEDFAAILWQGHLAASTSLGDRKVTDGWRERWVPSSKEGFAQHPLAAVEGKVGLVYGGATKIKGYVFEAAKLPEVRGASGLLDRINLVDGPALWGREPTEAEWGDKLTEALRRYEQIRETFGDDAPLAPECIIYANGGDILALAPASLASRLAHEIERLYTTETLVGRGVAVAGEFSLLELQYGLRPNEFWIQEYQEGLANNELEPILRAYYGTPDPERGETDESLFFRRKTFNELSTSLALERHKRRDGNENPSRPIPNFETISYARRCSACDRRGAVYYFEAQDYYLCEPCARKRYVGYLAKKLQPDTSWFTDNFRWQDPQPIWLWYWEFERYLAQDANRKERYYGQIAPDKVDNPWDLSEIAQVSDPNRFIGLIYADGNNVGSLIERIASPAAYRQFAQRLFLTTRDAVFASLAEHLQAASITASEERTRWTGKTGDVWIHPFEILSIGGDDLLLIVPGSKALEIANDIAKRLEQPFQSQWLFKTEVKDAQKLKEAQRYWPVDEEGHSTVEEPMTQPVVSLSAGVVIAAENTPVFFLLNLAGELLRLAKDKAKGLKKEQGYHGGTVDFLVLKSIPMVTTNLRVFRDVAHTVKRGDFCLRLIARPYTLQEMEGLVNTVRTLKEVDFPRTQLYTLHGFLRQGQMTAMINYLYYRTRLKEEKQRALVRAFDWAWHRDGMAPWRKVGDKVLETSLGDLIEVYEFIEKKPA